MIHKDGFNLFQMFQDQNLYETVLNIYDLFFYCEKWLKNVALRESVWPGNLLIPVIELMEWVLSFMSDLLPFI